jgi:hypothetical protein
MGSKDGAVGLPGSGGDEDWAGADGRHTCISDSRWIGKSSPAAAHSPDRFFYWKKEVRADMEDVDSDTFISDFTNKQIKL